ncbi:AAA family ATPase [Candidatus Magnetaquicoccus inordinatus]|uniref:cytidylate kinase-like family protein n=1 Tax=Candidatus Magnetaquicoccus inordinatus TaxID=2496818 RepID=UPI00102B9993|nr:cytidylate kinase-like family protein [Candidatus Magnetaquicoccus inordinatus]
MGKLIGIQGISMSTYFDPKRVEECNREKRCPVVTVSRSFGANGSQIAELLAESLTVPCFGYSMLDGIVREAKSDKYLMSLIDERAPGPLEDWIHAMFTKGEVSQAGFYRRLIKTVIAIAEGGGVIIGRGAHLVLANNPKVFRVRIEGSLEICAQRVAERENIKLKDAKERIFKVDNERKLYVRELYKRCPHQRAHYDLVLNSDCLTPETAVEIIIFTMEKMGYYVPGSELIKQQNL